MAAALEEHELPVSAWQGLPSDTPAATPAGVHDGTLAFALDGTSGWPDLTEMKIGPAATEL